MEPLLKSRELLIRLCVLPPGKHATKRMRAANAMHTFSVSVATLSALLGSIAYLQDFGLTNLDASLYALFQTIVFMVMMYSIIITAFMRGRIVDMFAKLSKIYEENASELYGALSRVNNLSDRMWDIHFKLTKITIANLVFLPLVSMIYCYISHGKLDEKHFYRPGYFSFPWNQHSLSGYFAEIALSISIGYAYLITNNAILVTFISLSMHHQAFCERFQKTASQLNDQERKVDERKCFRDLIEFHISSKSWFKQTAAVFSPYVFIQLVYSIAFLASIAFYMEKEIQNLGLHLLNLMVGTTVGLSTILLYCYYGKIATESFERMGHCLYEIDWQNLPIIYQKYIVLIIGNTLKPLHYHGFGVVILNLETFCKFLRTVYSYYMLLKTKTHC